MWDLSSRTRGQTHTLCSDSVRSLPPDRQGSPVERFLILSLMLTSLLTFSFLSVMECLCILDVVFLYSVGSEVLMQKCDIWVTVFLRREIGKFFTGHAWYPVGLETYSLNSGFQVAKSGVREMIDRKVGYPHYPLLSSSAWHPNASKADAISLWQVPDTVEHMGGAQ